MTEKQNRKRILIVTDAWRPQVNGVVRTYEHLGVELEQLGYEVKIIGPCDFPRRLAMPGYREIELTLFPYKKLAAAITDFQPDSIHIATEGPLGWAARRWCRRHKKQFTTAYHTQFPLYVGKRVGKILPFLERWATKKTAGLIRRFHSAGSGIIITTDSLKHELLAQDYQTPLFTLKRGVPIDLFTPGSATLFADLPRPIALYVGRVAIEKNLDAFLDMDWHGSKVVVGDGPNRQTMTKKYPAVHFAGVQTGAALADHYRSSDVFIFPSKTDTFGIVILEALACGLPVAAYPVTGPRDIITEEFLGRLNDDLAAAAQQALQSGSHERRRHDHIKEHYSWPAITKDFIHILDETNT